MNAGVFTMSKSHTIPTSYSDSSGGGLFNATEPLEGNRRGAREDEHLSTASTAQQPPTTLLYHGGTTFDLREGHADTLHCQFDLVRRSDVDQENMIFPILHQFAQPRLQLRATSRGKAALKDGKLNPFVISVHGLEHATPAPTLPAEMPARHRPATPDPRLAGQGQTARPGASPDRRGSV